MPQDSMRDRVSRIQYGSRTLSSVMGQMPPLARVAAITAAESHVTSTEHSCNGQSENCH